MTPPCRACGTSELEIVLSLGEMPLSNAFVDAAGENLHEARYPLELAVCRECGLAQLTTVVDPADLFQEYPYFSSFSTTMLGHAEDLVGRLIGERHLGPSSLAMEIASNDGYLLQNYVKAGIPVLGIDPARNVVEVARERGVETRCEFFGPALAEELRRSGLRASVLHANNVLAHVPDLAGVVTGIARVLDDDGVAVVETPYACDLVERGEFDTIYHEHLHYYSLTSLCRLFDSRGLRVVDVERISIHGGSLRVFAVPACALIPASSAVEAILAEEGRDRAATPEYFRSLAAKVSLLGERLKVLLAELKAGGHRLAGYGAAAKGTILLNTFGIGRETLDFVSDRNPHKHGRLMPGVHIPIAGPERILEDKPDEVLVLAWNFADEIIAQLAEYSEGGGRFVIPLPDLRVVG